MSAPHSDGSAAKDQCRIGRQNCRRAGRERVGAASDNSAQSDAQSASNILISVSNILITDAFH
jgi:hypothetical protein